MPPPPVKYCLIILLLWLSCLPARAQELTESMLPEMVRMVDGQIDLNTQQEVEFLRILKESYRELEKIRAARKPDLEKMAMILEHQKSVDARLRVLFTEEQFAAYKRFLHSEDEGEEAAGLTETVDPKRTLARELSLTKAQEESFIALLAELDARTHRIIQSPENPDLVGIDLLVEILYTDIQLIRLLGREVYADFFRKRTEGALTGHEGADGAEISSVLNFYDIAQTLELTGAQTRKVIRKVLEAEATKAELQRIYAQQPALLQEKLRLAEQNDLLDIQKLLSDSQWDKFLKLMGKK